MSYCAAAVALGEILQRVSADVKDYVVDGDGDAAPPASLARACALMEAPEVTAAVARVATAVAHGAAVGASAGARMVTKRTSAGAARDESRRDFPRTPTRKPRAMLLV